MSDVIIKSGAYQKATKSERDRVGGFSLFKKINEYLKETDPCCDKELVANTVTTDEIIEKTAGSGVEIDGIVVKDGGITAGTFIAGFYPQGASNNITAGTGGAISVTNYFTTINTDAGGDAFTLADGTKIGQLKLVRLVADGGGDAVITPANLSGGTTITMNDASDEVELQWNGTDWVVIKNLGATVA